MPDITTDAFDPTFYRQWYKDIRGMTPEQATQHWEKAGRAEGRFGQYSQLLANRRASGLVLPKGFRWQEYMALNGDLPRLGTWGQVNTEMHYLDSGEAEGRHYNYEALLKARSLDLRKLPEDFNWQAYLALNPKLVAQYVNSRYLAEAHYLEFGANEKLDYRFDEAFYREHHGLTQLEATPEAAIAHFNAIGVKKNLAPSFSRWLEQSGLSAALLPPRFDFTAYKARRADVSDAAPYQTLFNLVRGDCIDASPVFDSDSDNLALYKHLGLQYERVGNDHQAHKFYSAALMFGSDGVLFESMGNIAMRLGRKSAALAWYRMSAAAHGFSPFVFMNGSRILLEQDQAAAALEFAAQGVEARPADASAMEANFRDAAQAQWGLVAQAIQPALAKGERASAIEEIQRMAQQQFDAHLRLLNPTNGALPPLNVHGRTVLIVGDHHIPQCIRYRIQQKAEQLTAAGYSVKVTDAGQPEMARAEMPWCDIVIFYRVPALPDIIQLMASARSHGKLVFYEVDDLVIDPAYPHPIDSFGGLVDVQQYQDLQQGMALMRAAATLCDYGIASTAPMQAALEPLVRQKICYLHRNGLDSQTMIPASPPDPDAKGYTNLFYGSGTKSHNSDFIVEALPAIERLLSEHPQLKLTVVGHLELPESVRKQHGEQIVQIEHIGSVQAYWNYLAASNINLAVLTADAITNAKSELKWFEAACFGVPSVVSATQNYLDVIQDGQDGLIAYDTEGWYTALSSLINDPTKRKTMGIAARERVMAEYSISTLSKAIDQTIRSARTHATRWSKRRQPKTAQSASL